MIYDLQKASLSKRISAYLFDFIIFLVLLTGFAALISLITGFDAKLADSQEHYAYYEEKYGIGIDEMNAYNALTDDERENLSNEEKENYKAAIEEFAADEELRRADTLVTNIILIMISMSFLFSYAILEFIVPLCLKNGQTLGKKIFSIALMRDDGVKASPVMLFVRSILGKYTIETMVPVFLLVFFFMTYDIIPLFVILILLIFNAVLFFRTKTHSFIHDILAYTVAVDLQSQMIFETKEDLIAYKNKIHAESLSESSSDSKRT